MDRLAWGLGEPGIVATLAAYLDDPDWRLRNATAALLRGYGRDLGTTARVARCLDDTNEVIRLSAAVTVLGDITPRDPLYRVRALGVLAASLRSSTLSAPLRLHAVRQLGYSHVSLAEAPELLPILAQAALDPDPEVRTLAARILAEIDPQPPRPSVPGLEPTP